MSIPLAVAYAADRRLDHAPEWTPCRLIPGEAYRLTALTEGTAETEDIGALVAFEMDDPDEGGDGLRPASAKVPPHIYFRTGPGLHRTDRLFTVASPVRRFGLMAWHNRGPVMLRTMTVEQVSIDAPSDFFFSFDVEGNPSRSAGTSPIDSLVWGRVGGGEYGISRICDVLEQHAVIGNFLIDFATCAIEGEARLAAIIDHIGSRGHEIHMHLHPDRLAPAWGLTVGQGKSIQLDSIGYEMSRRLLDYTVSTFERLAQRPARVFRSGAYRMNADLVLAAGSLGIEALTNVRKDVVGDPMIAGGDLLTDREPFVWDNGVVELPVDISSPEAGSVDKYLVAYGRTMSRKRGERTFNVVMHSFSLLRRNDRGIHDTFAPEFEENLHRICEHATKNGRVRGYAEYLDDTRIVRPVVRIAQVRDRRLESPVYVPSPDVARCNLCDAIFDRSHGYDGHCPSCGLGPEHRTLRHALDNYGDVFGGRVVLALGAELSVHRRLLQNAAGFQPVSWDLGLSGVADASVDAIVAFGAPASAFSPDFLEDADRVLRSRGLLIAIVPPPVNSNPGDRSATFHIARDRVFEATAVPGFDPVTRATSLVVIGVPTGSAGNLA